MAEQEKSLEMSELVADIQKAGESELVVEFEYPYSPGVYFQLAFASRYMLRRLGDGAREQFFNTRTRQSEERLNTRKFDQATSRELIRGWRGLTYGVIKKIVPGLTLDIPDSTEIPFDDKVAYELQDKSLDFQVWVTQTAMNPENFAKIGEKKKEQYENLS